MNLSEMNQNEIEHAKVRLQHELRQSDESVWEDDVLIVSRAALIQRTDKGALFRLVGPEGPDMWMPVHQLTSFELDSWGPVRGADWLREKAMKFVSMHLSRMGRIKGQRFKTEKGAIPFELRKFFQANLEKAYAPTEIVYETDYGEKITAQDLIRSVLRGQLEGRQWMKSVLEKSTQILRDEANRKGT